MTHYFDSRKKKKLNQFSNFEPRCNNQQTMKTKRSVETDFDSREMQLFFASSNFDAIDDPELNLLICGYDEHAKDLNSNLMAGLWHKAICDNCNCKFASESKLEANIFRLYFVSVNTKNRRDDRTMIRKKWKRKKILSTCELTRFRIWYLTNVVVLSVHSQWTFHSDLLDKTRTRRNSMTKKETNRKPKYKKI